MVVVQMASLGFTFLGALGVLLAAISDHRVDGLVVSARSCLDLRRGSSVAHPATFIPGRHDRHLRDGADPLRIRCRAHVLSQPRATHWHASPWTFASSTV